MWKPGQIVTLHIWKYLFCCRIVKAKTEYGKYFAKQLQEKKSMQSYLKGRLPEDCYLDVINTTEAVTFK